MDSKAQRMAPQGAEVSMLAPEIVRQIRELKGLGWGAKRIASETGVARGTVRRYLRGGASAEVQQRPGAHTLDPAGRALAFELLYGPAQGMESWCAVCWRSVAWRCRCGRCSAR